MVFWVKYFIFGFCCFMWLLACHEGQGPEVENPNQGQGIYDKQSLAEDKDSAHSSTPNLGVLQENFSNSSPEEEFYNEGFDSLHTTDSYEDKSSFNYYEETDYEQRTVVRHGRPNAPTTDVTRFVKQFYGSLELSREDNNEVYSGGLNLKFSRNEFDAHLAEGAYYNEKRVDLLTDKYGYHTHFHLELDDILSISPLLKEINNESSDSLFYVITEAVYSTYEGNTYHNKEQLTLVLSKNQLFLKRWDDIELVKMVHGNYHEPSEREFREIWQDQ